MLETILAISGKPGLFKLVSRGNRSLIVETLDAQKKRFPAFGADKVISLADIAMYTDEKEVPLREVLNNIKAKESGKTASIDWRKASKDELFAYLGEVLPNFDGDRIYPSDVKKLVQWYNVLIENGLTDFDETFADLLMDPPCPPVDEPADPMGRGVRGKRGNPPFTRLTNRQKRNRLGNRNRKDRHRRAGKPK